MRDAELVLRGDLDVAVKVAGCASFTRVPR